MHPTQPSQPQNQAAPLNNVNTPAKVGNSNEVCTGNGIKSPSSVSSEGPLGEKNINDDLRFAIIDAIYLQPAIWASSCARQAKSLCERKSHFVEIAKLLTAQNTPISATDVEKQWKNLKDTYNKVKKKIAVDESGCMVPPRWRFFNAMLFLDQQVDSYNHQRPAQQSQQSQVVQNQVAHNNIPQQQSQQSIVVMTQQEHHHGSHHPEESRKRTYAMTVDADQAANPHKIAALENPREQHVQQMQIINLEGRTLTSLTAMPTTSMSQQSYIHQAQIPVTISQQPQLVDAHHTHLPVQMVSAAELVSTSVPMPVTSQNQNHVLIPPSANETSQLEAPVSAVGVQATPSVASNSSEDEYDAFCRSLAFPLREIGARNRIEFLRLQKAIRDQIFEKQMATLIPSSQQQQNG